MAKGADSSSLVHLQPAIVDARGGGGRGAPGESLACFHYVTRRVRIISAKLPLRPGLAA